MRLTFFVNVISRSRIVQVLLCSVLLGLPGCTLLKLQRNVSEIERSIVLGGRTLTPEAMQGSVIVLVYEQTSRGNELVDFQLLDADGHFLFLVPQERDYFIVAFLDTNNSLSYEAGEPAGYYGQPTSISESMEHADDGVTINLSLATTLPAQFPLDLSAASIVGNKNIPLIFGEVISLDDARLSREMAQKSLWAPLDFARQNGLGVFFLDEYDPNKIPILFVHGFGGTPLDWDAIINRIDRSCYQPWLFYYPTGVRLAKSERLMTVVLNYFKDQYDFSELYIVAHSMGGLIARSYIVNTALQGKQSPVNLFVTFSTPWNGHTAAAQGASNSPVVMPAWLDIQPDSNFIHSLFTKDVSEHMDYYLFFSFNDQKSVFGLDSDGAVTLTSQLDSRAQAEAKKMYGVNASHRDILQDESVMESLSAILSTTTAASANPKRRRTCALDN